MSAISLGIALLSLVLVCPALGGDGLSEGLRRLAATPNPRLRFTAAEDPLAALRDASRLDPARAAVRARILKDADADLAATPPKFVRNGRRLGSRVPAKNLAAAWRITGERKYAERALANLRVGGTWPDWSPGHYLGTAQVASEYAHAYDWIAETLSEEERQEVFAIVKRQALSPIGFFSWWRYTDENWAQVCYEGVAAVAIAFYDRFPREADAWLREAASHVVKAVRPYAPHGAYPEGPGYWEYGTDAFTRMLEEFSSGLGTDVGLSSLEGFSETADYMRAVEGAGGLVFNYSDCGALRRRAAPVYARLAVRAGRRDLALPELAAWKDGTCGADSLEMLLTRGFPGSLKDEGGRTLALDWYSGGRTPVATLRTSLDAQAAFVGVKGGSARANHAHMDIGSFVYDVAGERWALDLGNQNYASLEKALGGRNALWDMSQGSKRWSVFRLGSESHNVVTANGERQRVGAFAEVLSDGEGRAKLDLTEVFGRGVCTRAERTFALDRTSGALTVEDRFEGVKKGTRLDWAFLTDAKAVAEGGVLRLEKNGKRVLVTAAEPVGATWRIEDVSRPKAAYDVPNPGVKRAVCGTEAGESGKIGFRVIFCAGGGDDLV